MSYDELKSDLLAARDARQRQIEEALGACFPATIAITLNIPGADKHPPGYRRLFVWGWRALGRSGLHLTDLFAGVDRLGPHALFGTTLEADAAKRLCVAIETGPDFGRLLDLDVFDRAGRSVDRAALGLPQRPCLLCDQPARECIRLARHDHDVLLGRIHDLLAPFRD